ncbi:MAG: methyltransferase domain-containing protein [Anaerolineales bacterium]|nr:methyltransferase domain-containing protein [Anaerolineales bacterium]
MDPKAIVRAGYDKVSYAYRDETFDYARSGYHTFLNWLEPRLDAGARILDLGCGCGIPVAQVLSEKFQVTGVDISAVQVERARKLAPAASFICADIGALAFAPGSFAAIVAFYSIIHIPLEEQPALFVKLAQWLTPNGYLLATVGHTAWTGTEANWRDVEGATMYWSHSDADAYCNWFEMNGLHIVQEGFLPEGDGGHTVLLGQKIDNSRRSVCYLPP